MIFRAAARKPDLIVLPVRPVPTARPQTLIALGIIQRLLTTHPRTLRRLEFPEWDRDDAN